MRLRLRAVWDRIRGTYWAVPSGMATVAVAASLIIIDVDRALTADLLNRLTWVYTGGAEGARAVLSTIAASMITVAGVTFSVTIVALTLASQQFGPRLLRNFLRDLGNQITLGTFIATFLYCLLVLRTVRGTDDDQFVPHLAVTVGVALATLSIGVLIYFIHHIATSIQASQVIANVATDLRSAIDRLYPARIGHAGYVDHTPGNSSTAAPDFAGARTILARQSGYVQALDSARLLAIARDGDAVVRIDARPGGFVRPGSPLAAVVSSAGRAAQVDEDALRRTFIIGADRTGTQDLGFFVNQLVELGVRALSPGINDPETARACIDRLEGALVHLLDRQTPSAYRYDDDNVLRVVARPVTVAATFDLAFSELSRYGASSVSVSCRLLEAIRDLAPRLADEHDRQALAHQAAMIGDRCATTLPSEVDRAQVAGCGREALEALQRPRIDSPDACVSGPSSAVAPTTHTRIGQTSRRTENPDVSGAGLGPAQRPLDPL